MNKEENNKKKKISANEIEKLHQKLANKHRLQSTIRGISLSEELQSNNYENYSALDWVQKSRNLQKTHQFNAKLNDLYDDDEEEDDVNSADGTEHLKGKVVDHNISDFKKGETKILILKDSAILDAKMEINENEDELINVAMFEQEQRQNKLNELENKRRNRKYNQLDEANYNVLLPQYEEKQKDITKSFVLNEDGKMDQNAQTSKILSTLNMTSSSETITKEPKFDSYDLSDLSTTKTIASDFVVKFKKKKRKKKKKKRKRNETETDDKETAATDAKKRRKVEEAVDEKYSFLDDDGETKSRAKRDDILSALKLSEIEEKEEKERLNRYNIALQKANKSMAENLALNNMLNELDGGDIGSDDDDIFNANLQRAEKLKHKTQNKTAETNGASMEVDDGDKNGESVVYAENAEADGVVFSIATQFSDGLCGAMSEMVEENAQNAHAVANGQMAEIETKPSVNEEENDEDDDVAMNESKGGWVEYDEQDKQRKMNEIKKDKKKKKEDANKGNELLDSSILDREPLCARSLSDTLSHIRRRGYLHDDDGGLNANEMGIGKGFKPAHIGISKSRKEEICKKWDVDAVLKWLKKEDKYLYNKYAKNFELKRIDGAKLINSCGSSSFLRGVIGMKNGHFDISKFMNILGKLKGDPAPDITLSHQDEFGKPMTAKEAFRTLSHKFHGKKSGPKKQEKRLKKQQIELMRKKNGSVDTPLGTLQKLKSKTASLNKPFVVLDKN